MTSTKCHCCLGGFDSKGYACQYCFGTGWRIDSPAGSEMEPEGISENNLETDLTELA